MSLLRGPGRLHGGVLFELRPEWQEGVTSRGPRESVQAAGRQMDQGRPLPPFLYRGSGPVGPGCGGLQTAGVSRQGGIWVGV